MDRPILGQFRQARATLQKAIASFPPAKRLETLFDKWSLKDLVAHLSGWDLYTLTVFQTIRSQKTPDWGASVNRFNSQSLSQRKDWSWAKVYREFTTLGRLLETQFQSTPNSLWTTKIWPNKNLTPEKLLQIDIDHYLKDHLPSLIVKTSSQKDA